MKNFAVTGLALLGLAGCSTAPGTAAPGQLFCAIQTADGAIVAGLIDAVASGLGAGPVTVLATNAGKLLVDSYCAQAGGIPVSPPANPAAAPQIAIPAGQIKAGVAASTAAIPAEVPSP